MKYTNLDAVEPGQILGKTIFSANGNVLLAENVQLTVFMIHTMKRIGVEMLYIKDELLADVEIEEVVSDETKQVVVKQMSRMFDAIRSGKEFDARSSAVSVDTLLDEVISSRDVLIQLSDIRTEDNEMYVHALNVCILSVMTGMNLGLNANQLRELAMGALLHDVGKIGLDPDNELRDPRRHHTWRGFELLKRDFSLMVAHIAFQHHETPDGKGMPRQLVQDEIHLYAKIVAVANRYDRLVSTLSSESERILPHDACERLMAMSGIELDTDVLIAFLRIVSVYPTGISVRLNTREVGIVVGQHRGLPARPRIRIFNKDGNGHIEVKETDLATNPTVFIEAVLS